MPRIFDFGGREVERSQTIAGLRALKGSGRRAAQVTAETADEAAAVEAAGIEMVVCRAVNVTRVREGSRRVFVTAALGFADAITGDEILRTAFGAVTSSADAVITGRGYEVVRMPDDSPSHSAAWACSGTQAGSRFAFGAGLALPDPESQCDSRSR
jgi:3-methyl-2-oxobutanoate hydroxymethyltransferase